MSKKKRILLVTAVFVGILLLVQVATYVCFAERSMPASAIRCNPDYADRNLDLNFVCVRSETWAELTAAQKSSLEAALKRRAPLLYHSMDEVPVVRLHVRRTTAKDLADYASYKKRGDVSPRTLAMVKRKIDRGYEVLALKKGAKVGWELTDRGLFWTRCSSSAWSAQEGACWREDVYVWVLGFWVRVWNTSMAMS